MDTLYGDQRLLAPMSQAPRLHTWMLEPDTQKMLQRIILLEPEVGDGEHASHRRRRYRNRNWGSCFHGRQPPRHYHGRNIITVASTFFFAARDDNEAKRAREQIEVGHGTLS